eukprot:1356077-Amorphochlora_amoeboformis.AAC.1
MFLPSLHLLANIPGLCSDAYGTSLAAQTWPDGPSRETVRRNRQDRFSVLNPLDICAYSKFDDV